ncbi:MAG: AmmeMemoRadiSam system protein A [Humidesulfovibrio sp.]|nr:AmmeMemoRadiSam system protein A [Humidesulfovibrio sp.]
MERFSLSPTDADKAYLKNLALLSITSRLAGRGATPPPPSTELLERELGAFVTFKRDGQLRGCIGNIIGQGPLCQTVWDMAQAAAFQDPRFPPLTKAELEGLEIEISILGPIEPCPDPKLVVVGRHGLIMRQGARQGLLLPQVPMEWGWDREQFLAQTCRKAGLPATAWRDPATAIYWFEAVFF